jgi:catechol 2,3-dioxygenase-like lactoylglutathione lyase family enzyme
VFDHVTIRVADRGASERFYETVLAALGIEQTYSGEDFAEWDDFSLAEVAAGKPPTKRLHVGFVAPSREHVDAFWQAGTEAGYRDDGAFLLDPDGNSAEAVHTTPLRRGGMIDQLWIRVADLAAARRFYETIAPFAGFELRGLTPERATFVGASGSFSIVADGAPATRNVHLAFGAKNAAVDRFHAAATAAGYRDNGPPGERPEYHAGYYGAYVLDPDGNNVEVVNHNRSAS